MARRPARTQRRTDQASTPARTGSDCCGCSSCASIDWDWPDAPAAIPILLGDLPRQDKPLPKALDDPAAAKLLRAAQAHPRQLVRVVCEVLIRTGLRVSELDRPQADAVMQIGAGHWLHVPVGKLRDDRYIPLHPQLVTLIADYRPPTSTPATRCCCRGRTASRWTATASPATSTSPPPPPGIGHVHPHQMRHTLATQAINRGMSLEAIAALLGHHSMDMTLRYAKIANRTVADEYFAVTAKVEALYDSPHRAARGRRRTRDDAHAPRDAPADARQRLLHPPTSARLQLRIGLRDLHLLPDRIEFRPDPASPTRPRRHSRPARPPACSPDCSTTSRNQHHDHLDTDHPHNAAERAGRHPTLSSLHRAGRCRPWTA